VPSDQDEELEQILQENHTLKAKDFVASPGRSKNSIVHDPFQVVSKSCRWQSVHHPKKKHDGQSKNHKQICTRHVCACAEVSFVNLIIRILHYTLMNDQLLTQHSSATKLALLTDGIIIS
jgi:hypothetical protein